jgi:hypothetical protein
VSAQQIKQVNKVVNCGDAKLLINELRKVNENPVWVGDVDDGTKSRMSLWISKENNTWTLLQNNDIIACVIDYGNKNVFSSELFGGKGG